MKINTLWHEGFEAIVKKLVVIVNIKTVENTSFFVIYHRLLLQFLAKLEEKSYWIVIWNVKNAQFLFWTYNYLGLGKV